MNNLVYYLHILFALLFLSCAQVPKESIELSNTVGRDIEAMHKAHRELVRILYDRIESDITKFVNDVYIPYQISKLTTSDQEDYKNKDSNSLLYTINAVSNNPDDIKLLSTMNETLEIFVQELYYNVESFRNKRLQLLREQERQVLREIDQSYDQIIYANSVITGHLATVLKVNDAQQEIINKIDSNRLSERVSSMLEQTSDHIAFLTDKAKTNVVKLNDNAINVLTQSLDSLFTESLIK